LAVGDVVSQLSGVNVVQTFQPAVGSECIITCLFNHNIIIDMRLFDGVNNSGSGTGTTQTAFQPFKMFINNALYIRLDAVGAGDRSGFTGLQIK